MVRARADQLPDQLNLRSRLNGLVDAEADPPLNYLKKARPALADEEKRKQHRGLLDGFSELVERVKAKTSECAGKHAEDLKEVLLRCEDPGAIRSALNDAEGVELSGETKTLIAALKDRADQIERREMLKSQLEAAVHVHALDVAIAAAITEEVFRSEPLSGDTPPLGAQACHKALTDAMARQPAVLEAAVKNALAEACPMQPNLPHDVWQALVGLGIGVTSDLDTVTVEDLEKHGVKPLQARRPELLLALKALAPTSQERVPEDAPSGRCVMCLDAPADHAVVPCGHQCGCNTCFHRLRKAAKENGEQSICPLCRGPISRWMKVYNTGIKPPDDIGPSVAWETIDAVAAAAAAEEEPPASAEWAECAECGENKNRDEFSRRQWEFAAGKCMDCTHRVCARCGERLSRNAYTDAEWRDGPQSWCKSCKEQSESSCEEQSESSCEEQSEYATCAHCGREKHRDNFSTTQWNRDNGKCHQCTHRECRHCEEDKPRNAYTNSQLRKGQYAWCKACNDSEGYT